MKSSKKLQISSHLLFVYINNQDRKWRVSVLVFSSALVLGKTKIKVKYEKLPTRKLKGLQRFQN